MAQSNSLRAFAPDEVLEFSRTFDAPRELVWRLWRDPEHVVRWHGPQGMWLTSCEMLVHGSNRDRALTHRFGDALDGAVTHVTHREYAGRAGFEGQGWPVGRPRIGRQVATREHKAVIVATDRLAEPVRARFGSDHHEHGG